ncbi:troponin c-like protein [Plasmodium gonderi]|uniref:Troponin c-like protein n=1 Tax=Plasmodium gonderi TaxID=77519 RepID=A0A1Y1JGU9_PLAGO|nr:troponin c-like protein [Plasmodium gonderi]GAW81759.1 troponin c-like protein [Plasmodium gonderi]
MYIYVCMCACVHVCMFTYVCIYVCTYVCMHVWTYVCTCFSLLYTIQELTSEIELTSLFMKLSDGSKTVNSENALEIVYKLGYVPSKDDIDEFICVTNGVCSLSNIKKFCKKLKSCNYSTDGLLDVFNYYDVHRTGKISKDQFKLLFTTIGSKMSNAEMEEIIRELCNDSDQICYEEFLSK